MSAGGTTEGETSAPEEDAEASPSDSYEASQERGTTANESNDALDGNFESQWLKLTAPDVKVLGLPSVVKTRMHGVSPKLWTTWV
jgi:hypothetical protein